MNGINFNCPACRQNIEAPEEMAGHVIECPACEKSIVIPSRGGTARLYGDEQEQKPIEKQPASVPEQPSVPEPSPLPAAGRRKIVFGKVRGKRTVAASRPSTETIRRMRDARQRPVSFAEGRHEKGVSTKRRTTALLLFLFLWPLGVHRFYVGKAGTGFLFIVTLGGLGIWSLVDLIQIASGAFRDSQGRLVKNW